MKSISITGKSRTDLGKKATKLLRKNQEVPCVLYGGEKTFHFHAPAKEFKDLIYTPHTFLVDLNIDGTAYRAVIKDTQFHVVTDALLHLDFYQIFDKNKITVLVPVATHGFAKGVQEGGKLQILNRKLHVRGFANDIPDILNINIENLGLGKTIKVGELSYENVELTDPKNLVVCTIKLTRAAKGGTTEEGAETPAAETPAAESK
jgi:large subunit ribosomal protein L25